MKRRDIDPQLTASAPERTVSSIFVRDTMKRIHAETISPVKRKTSTHLSRSLFMKFMHTHKLAFGLLAFIITSLLTFSGYAYAIGTDPISLIRRWIDGEKVMIHYGERRFEHGIARSYSDAAITAYAELNTVDLAHFHAANRLEVPHDGIEHVSDPAQARTYAYPVIASIREVDADMITIEKVYLRGDKMTPSRDMSETITVPEDDMFYYRELKPLSPLDSKGKLVALYQNSYLRHKIGTREITSVTAYFAFELSHPLADYREADAAMRDPKPDQGPRWKSEAVMPLIERNFGALSPLCVNNGADACDMNQLGRSERGESLYGKEVNAQGTFGKLNPDAIAYGEGAPDNAQPAGIISRNIEGKIIALSDSEITLKGSSGGLWHLDFPSAKRNNFKKTWGHDLKIGMTLGGMILERIDNLDNRHITDRSIYSMKKY